MADRRRGRSGPSTKTRLTFDGAGDFSAETTAGRNLHFGIREHAMGAVLNGLALSKIRPFGRIPDLQRLRPRGDPLGALMEIPVIYIFTHDSIGVGEDGPTHQPVEHLASLRAIPGLITLRPADANEVVEAWSVIMQLRHEPVALILTRQALPTLDRTKYASAGGVQRGAYVLADAADGTARRAAARDRQRSRALRRGVRTAQGRGHQGPGGEHAVVGAVRALLPRSSRISRAGAAGRSTARVSVEKASTLGWARYVGRDGHSIGMETFGASAPLKELQKKFGFTAENVVAAARQQIAGKRGERCASR